MRGAETPNVGRASFEVRLSADGRVIGVRLASANGGASDVWDRVAKATFLTVNEQRAATGYGADAGGDTLSPQ